MYRVLRVRVSYALCTCFVGSCNVGLLCAHFVFRVSCNVLCAEVMYSDWVIKIAPMVDQFYGIPLKFRFTVKITVSFLLH